MKKRYKLPRYQNGSLLGTPSFFRDDTTLTNSIGYGSQIAGALLPSNNTERRIIDKTGISRTTNDLDDALMIGSQFTPTKGLITRGSNELGNSLDESIGGTTGAVLGNTVKYTGAGAEIGSAIGGPVGALAGAGIGAATGLITGFAEGDDKKRVLKQEANENANAIASNLKNRYNEALLSGFKPKGNQAVSYFRKGGYLKYASGGFTPEYEVENGETVQGNDTSLEDGKQLSSDMMLVRGNSHEQGGTMGAGGDRVFSDRLKISPEGASILKSLGLKNTDNKTYAALSKKISSIQNKIEKTNSPSIYRTNTSKLMSEKINLIKDIIFNDQETGKQSVKSRYSS